MALRTEEAPHTGIGSGGGSARIPQGSPGFSYVAPCSVGSKEYSGERESAFRVVERSPKTHASLVNDKLFAVSYLAPKIAPPKSV